MLDKLKFNNLVITNKKVIQQARAQTVSKLVQKLRKVKDVLTKHPDNEKHKERLRKSSECVAQLKALKSLDIMRQLLLQDGKNPNAVLTNGRSTPDEVVLAMLALNKLMKALVDTFRQTLGLDSDKDSRWREEILETSKRRVKLERTETKKKQRKELKEQKAQTRNRLEWLEKNKVGTVGGTDVTETDVLPATESAIEEVETAEEQKQKPKQEKPLRNPKVPSVKKEEKSKLREERKQKPKPEKPLRNPKVASVKEEEKPKQREKKQPQKEKLEIKPKPKPIDIKEKPRKREQEKEASIEKEVNDEKDRPTHVIDPFFITESGQPYLSSAVVHSEDNESENEQEPMPHPAKRSRNEHRPTYSREERRPEINSKKPTEDLHPSWIAKQQQKPVIGHFKGKKIKFGDDGQAAEIKLPAVEHHSAPAFAHTPTPTSMEGMHPSWIAKQKWKPKIAAFQGTKIKFDED
ncbi:serum response factor-binding protein 1 [Drosophila subobscura]|uniref:serum response factor-binding protein 1 n=1 Tax=Drosophila subobscura TaxID=7241 RepID=UPI00155A6264|nr:serum response factor-binding protein 1 [Drosophila subobscura]